LVVFVDDSTENNSNSREHAKLSIPNSFTLHPYNGKPQQW
jgi:hypothetical protein